MDISADTVAAAFITGWVSHYCVPSEITTDQGRQFESKLFAELMQLIGTKHLRTSSRHPHSNGILERFHRTLKAALKCKSNQRWTEELPLILLALQSVFKDDIQASPAEMVYGTSLKLPGEFFEKTSHIGCDSEFAIFLRETMDQLCPVPGSNHAKAKTFVQRDLQTCSHVFLRDDNVRPPLKSPYDGPYKVIRRDRKLITILIKDRPVQVSIDRVKAAYLLNEEIESNTQLSRYISLQSSPDAQPIRRPQQELNSGHSASSGRVIRLPVRFLT
ncbi:uncharacterized protein LOC119687791 [Teleopsis dalmanni]|uniref:uncharacterized protein LOC119663917 n=1 Tax=Teleopsis dalmanni TaxID=139649 RepID=UPI0018CFC880|nr:uncharacterized protein LOC119663917 [Teleopsis dalmanni]XP_037929657.1 uncharacterized protein LOC119664193 [Teleopsis dalmanni]XP_037929737.1 uncharacterized protein LOC119664297 [Teleopsis dalmanni]XP_037930284.1 uncharacterized protein LOC119665025 [Teleopsis dalmanni]XP_037958209.1 uncharacterized protein LOC119687791 [Teleopsis dalmanni]